MPDTPKPRPLDPDYDPRVLRIAEDFARWYGCSYADAERLVMNAASYVQRPEVRRALNQ